VYRWRGIDVWVGEIKGERRGVDINELGMEVRVIERGMVYVSWMKMRA
jgi:hypothetical protein